MSWQPIETYDGRIKAHLWSPQSYSSRRIKVWYGEPSLETIRADLKELGYTHWIPTPDDTGEKHD